MYTHSEVQTFQSVLKPLVDHGAINNEIFMVALNAVKAHLKASTQPQKAQREKLLSRKEVAKMLGKSNKTIDRMREDGSLRCIQIRSSIMFKESDILAVMNNYEERY